MSGTRDQIANNTVPFYVQLVTFQVRFFIGFGLAFFESKTRVSSYDVQLLMRFLD